MRDRKLYKDNYGNIVSKQRQTVYKTYLFGLKLLYSHYGQCNNIDIPFSQSADFIQNEANVIESPMYFDGVLVNDLFG